jgi:Domain of unknown function (DUF4153)
MLSGRKDGWRDEILEPAWRFPLPILFAFIATIINLGRGEYHADTASGQLALTLYCAASFFCSWAAALWAEVHSDRVTGLLIGLGGAVLLALIFRLDLAVPLWMSGASGPAESLVTVSHVFVLAALTIAPSLAPYLSRRASQSAFWQYNHKWAIGYLAALIGACLAFAGAAAIIGSCALLLEVPVPSWIYGNIWVVSSFLMLPWVWLALAPDDFSEETKTGAHQEFTSRAVGLLVVYILIPVTFGLSAVLAAYVIKVLIEGSFATAQLGLTSLAYGASVIGVMLMAYPQREEHTLVRLFWRAWPFLLVVPTIVVIPALWMRIAEYGWTPSRYLAVAVGVWIAGVMLVGILMLREEDLRVVTGLVIALLLLTAFGPWGIAEVSGRSQFARLEALLNAKGLLENGRWRGSAGPIPWDRTAQPAHAGPGQAILAGNDDRKTAASVLNVLSETGEQGRLQPWFEGQADDPFASSRSDQVVMEALQQKLGLRSPSQMPADATRVAFSATSPTAIALPGERGTLIGPISLTSNTQPLTYETVAGKLSMALTGKQLDIDLGEGRIASFDLSAALDGLKVAVGAGVAPPAPQRQALMLEGGSASKARLAITYLSGSIADAQASLQLTAYLLLPPEP